ncbi:four helix bundle protein [Candidatus Roizmanbacteria bacterium RIFCSPHIGHO2_02_FULL_37_15]|uniref:Four helix bundle protein n=1 Tax=Candidatus Roizmanbacteria bacterium RIFCSPLOWO2_01_FULL_37_16 TaxID=1802058 RepID=A0A1F7IIL5_9BACT|nr:MAG: four helix bundle protein [Candidatus Roizmanbacteria bacterium RIFCSPHIGHO2_01_FULL_37_16b]OGK20747.1 MAG: four helix bundle protein [Candidatus Roizmanbacteria bacterium RIFCSPHIGHO2_02_FULL_37_15]OGK33033.1 MAG: four helix bundle protein [Candidatus Roizmanbacteria bacterium RIFCSPHIGHO2_12_FULL_36_11]OGK43199.1 MAG: four helix bundle protein [Candidatus Roizmanbacteria bacterium RIFCSPLOWO2_01_FULL_37_16]OGK56073.1 MAG: four helix bundle protein [Candidatus Roizmanbacteria bacterium
MRKFTNKKYDLEERTARFGEKIIDLCKEVPRSPVNDPIVNQLVRAGTSVGSNYCEANGASSKKDFRNKIFTCKKESKESKYWLRMLARAVNTLKNECRELWQEAQEFTLIFSKIASSSK